MLDGTLFECADDNRVYLTHPTFLLDPFIIHTTNTKIFEKDIQLLKDWCQIVEGTRYWVQNRCEELAYDLSLIPKHIEWKQKVVCNYMDHCPLKLKAL
jgi:hypothetical protein